MSIFIRKKTFAFLCFITIDERYGYADTYILPTNVKQVMATDMMINQEHIGNFTKCSKLPKVDERF